MFFFCLILTVLTLSVNNLSAATIEVNLLNIMQLALKNSPDLAISRHLLKESEAKLNIAEKKFLPSANLTISSVRENTPSYFLAKTADERSLNMTTVNLNRPGVHNHHEAGIEFGWPVYYRGLNNLYTKIAALEKNIADTSYEAAANSVISAAISLYYHYRTSVKQAESETGNLKRTESVLSEIRIRHEGGALLKTDVLAMQVRVEETRLALISAQNAGNITYAALKSVLGVTDSELVVLDSDWDLKTLPDTANEAVKIAFENRPELKKTDFMKSQADAGIRAAESYRRPDITLFGKYGANDSNLSFNSDQDNFFAGIRIGLNIFDSGLGKAEVREAELKKEEAVLYSAKVASDIRLEVAKSLENLKSAEESHLVSISKMNMAEENLTLTKNLYFGGSLTINSLLNAEAEYSRSQAARIAAYFDVLSKKAELGRALGYCYRCVSTEEDKINE